MKNYKYLVVTLLVLLVLLLLVKNNQLKSNLVNVDENLVFLTEQMEEPGDGMDTIVVTAENGIFSPSTINIQHLKPVLLQITAVDKDYKFVQAESGLDVEIPMGETVEVRLDEAILTIGEYKYTCGV